MRRVFIPHTLETLPRQLPVGDVHVLHGQTMGTTWSVKYLSAAPVSQAMVSPLIQGELDLVIAQMSTWQADSTLSHFNHAPADTWHAVPREFSDVLHCALDVASASDGAFDPAIGPLVNLWGFGPTGKRAEPPALAAIADLLTTCGWHHIQYDSVTGELHQPGGLYLDFSGIAKGYSVDRIARALEGASIDHYLVEVGGELKGRGIKPDGQPWWVSLESPPGAGEELDAVIALHGLAIATSGDYRRFFEHDHQRYAHTIDPRTGYPVKHQDGGIAAVTVVHPECMRADAYATAFTVMGLSAAIAFAAAHDIAAWFIVHEKGKFSAHATPSLAAMLE